MNLALKVIANEGENIESLLKRFKRKLKYEDRFREMRKKDFYVKNSDKKKLKKRRRKTSNGEVILNNSKNKKMRDKT